MRVVLGALWMMTTASFAAPAPLRFSVSDSWAMPMVQLDNGRPIQGILYDVMSSLATHVGHPAQFHARSEEQVLHKLVAGRYTYAASNEWIIDRFNQKMPVGHRLHKVAVIDEQDLGCLVRNDPSVPVQQILRTLLQMKRSGEIDDIIKLYTGEDPVPLHTPDKN